jgi:hypothetical protein
MPLREVVAVRNPEDETPLVVKLENEREIVSKLDAMNGLIPVAYDHVTLSYTGDHLTQATFKAGGPNGQVVATLILTYTANRLTSVTRT